MFEIVDNGLLGICIAQVEDTAPVAFDTMVIIHSQREKGETQTRGNSFATYRYAIL